VSFLADRSKRTANGAVVTMCALDRPALSAAPSDDKNVVRTGRQECHPYASLRDESAQRTISSYSFPIRSTSKAISRKDAKTQRDRALISKRVEYPGI